MILYEIHYGHVAALALANFLFSWAWYSPMLFANPWAKALKLKMPKKLSAADKKKMPLLFASGLIASFLLAFTLAVLVKSAGAVTFMAGFHLGLLCWAGFALTGTLNTMWEGKPGIVLAINNGLYILTYGLFGGILAAWH